MGWGIRLHDRFRAGASSAFGMPVGNAGRRMGRAERARGDLAPPCPAFARVDRVPVHLFHDGHMTVHAAGTAGARIEHDNATRLCALLPASVPSARVPFAAITLILADVMSQ